MSLARVALATLMMALAVSAATPATAKVVEKRDATVEGLKVAALEKDGTTIVLEQR